MAIVWPVLITLVIVWIVVPLGLLGAAWKASGKLAEARDDE
jgi:hypothetical protein